jgi:endonuclease YncB( thermonuclease family)
MRESVRRYAVRPLGALALAGILASLLVAVSPARLSEAARETSRDGFSGAARVIDGDTLFVGDARVRLEGIDAPEAGQECKDLHGRSWPCGQAATRKLSTLVAGKDVRCESSGTDKYSRILAVCWIGKTEINAEMVREGLAWAFVRYSNRLVNVETEARKLKAGIWQADNEVAWNYRAGRWTTAENTAPAGCAIKGNITKVGRTYHLPWNRSYNAVRINIAKGERWFCSEAEALEAGWQPVRTF